jgi:tetratricopeptide (TPR) repeat protein
MLKLIRVILSADISNFTSGMSRASGALSNFLHAARGSFSGAVGFANNLINALANLPQAVNTITNAFESLLSPAITSDKYKAIFGAITDSGEQGAAMFEHLEEMSTRYGLSLEGLLPAGQQVAVMLKGLDGEIDPTKWQEWTQVVAQFSALRPDVPLEKLTRGLAALNSGNIAQLEMILDAPLRQIIEKLGPEFQKFLQDGANVQNQQLGAVTRLGEGVGDAAGDGLALAQALAEALGADEELLEAYADTFEGQVNRMLANWDRFKRIVGEPILDVLNDALERLLTLLEENQPAVDAFAESLGEWAAVNLEKLIDWLFEQDWGAVAADIKEMAMSIKEFAESEQTAEAIDTLKNALVEFGKINLSGAKSALTSIDWEAVATSVNATARAFAFLVESYGSAMDFFTDQADDGAVNGSAPKFHGTGPDGTGAPELWNGKTVQMGGRAGDNSGSASVDLNITVGVDQNGNITPFVERIAHGQAVKAVGEFVAAKRRAPK